MTTRTPRATGALPAAEATALRRALTENDDVTVFVNGTAVKLPPGARDAVVDLLRRLAAGDRVTTASDAETLTTAQAAAAAGISHTYLRNLTDAGVIPVQYRGTHRRIKSQDIANWLAVQTSGKRAGAPPELPPE
ncbi:helix-turn-helix domain-containing protein [Arthrobacter sp. H20]|uniref:helix-turn-helix domain-containing protein n=1 Tax=Arthrobacter sp. H20 TaxID=1267981 RepID=UPI00047B6353|nr:helix-turn-helix domain-containing protein [Arthrobacter sp. H20]